jgi:hypothetical protein
MCRRLHIIGTGIATLIMLLEPALILGILVAAGEKYTLLRLWMVSFHALNPLHSLCMLLLGQDSGTAPSSSACLCRTASWTSAS